MAENATRPIIIKRKKVIAGGGHHGGAWKVAYADFVTAMMAFFMLMWLLNATTEQQRKGIADYFSPTIPITRISGGGDGAFGGDSPFSENTIAQNGTGATNLRPTEGRESLGLSGTDHDAAAQAEENAELAALAEALTGDSVICGKPAGACADAPDRRRPGDRDLLASGSGDLRSRNRLAPRHGCRIWPPPWLSLFGTVTNAIAIEGHVAAEPVVVASETRWRASTDRAQVFRALLERAELPPRRIVRVTGHADREPAADNPMARAQRTAGDHPSAEPAFDGAWETAVEFYLLGRP